MVAGSFFYDVNATNKDPRNQAPHTEYRFMFIFNIFFG